MFFCFFYQLTTTNQQRRSIALREYFSPMALPVIENRKARYEYHILETYETGVVLKGT